MLDFIPAMQWYYSPEMMKDYNFPADFITDFLKFYKFPLEESYPIYYIAIMFTVARYAFEILLCKPLIAWLKVTDKSDRTKFPESFWKFLVYLVLWAYCCYLLVFSGKYDYFTNPELVWDDWEIGMEIPEQIKWLYFIESGFYLHSVYATIFMDTKRKDFLAMLIHHFLTLALLIVSYGTRYHKVGIVVLFLHDVTDILLEFAKCNIHIKKRNGREYWSNDVMANLCFGMFSIAWYIFRLYWFPLKVLYFSSVVSAHRGYHRGAGLYLFFNGLLFTLLGLDLYWFYFILLFLYKVITGEVTEIKDTRDVEEEEEAAAAAASVEKKKEK